MLREREREGGGGCFGSHCPEILRRLTAVAQYGDLWRTVDQMATQTSQHRLHVIQTDVWHRTEVVETSLGPGSL